MPKMIYLIPPKILMAAFAGNSILGEKEKFF